nr:PAS domain-containing protein tyrosine kinase family protein [Tanacetum cinerariifolium]
MWTLGNAGMGALHLGMVVVCFYCPFVSLSGCHDGGGNRLTKTSLITHLRDRHCNGDAQAITRKSLSTNLVVFEEAEVTFKHMGIWLCGGRFKTHSLRSKCRHGKGYDFVSPPDCGDVVVRFVLYDLTKPHVPSSLEQLDDVDDLVQVQHRGFTLALLYSLFSKGLRTTKSIPPKCRLGFYRVIRKTLAESSPPLSYVDEEDIDLEDLKTKNPFKPPPSLPHISIDHRYLVASPAVVIRKTLAESSPPLSYVDEEDIDLEDLKTKNLFKPPPSLPHISIDHRYLVASPAVVLDRIKSFPHGTSCRRDGLRA